MANNKKLLKILEEGTKAEKLALFQFDVKDSDEEVVLKFGMWSRYFFPNFFKHDDAPFHREIDEYNLQVYRGKFSSFVNICYRGGAKSTKTKLFIAYVIANDLESKRKFIKILSKDFANSRQAATDIYNMLISIGELYPDIFAKTSLKRQETMSTFTTSSGVKVMASTVGQNQRGHLQQDSRPDFLWLDDIENSESLRSPTMTRAISDNIKEARNGLSQNGGSIYTCNYISERGVVHELVQRGIDNPHQKTLIIPIVDDSGEPTWSYYSKDKIEQIKRETTESEFAGEYLCQPSAGADIVFDRECVDAQESKRHIKDIAGFRVFYDFDPSHRYAGAADVAGGVGLDSSTSVFIDFSTTPARVVATYADNSIHPDIFGDELARQGDMFGQCLLAPERNFGSQTVFRLKQIYPIGSIYRERRVTGKIKEGKVTDYGWLTTGANKSNMIFDLKKAVENGWLELTDERLIAEVRSYSRDDLMDKEIDPRLTTRHFDLLMACAIAWQMKDEVVEGPAQTNSSLSNLEEAFDKFEAI